MDTFATATIYGTVSAPAEEKHYGLQNARRFYELSVSVESAQGKRVAFPVSVWDEGLMAQVRQLSLNQRVLLTCALSNKPWQGKDGKWRQNMSLRVQSIVAGQAHAAQRAVPDHFHRSAKKVDPAPRSGAAGDGLSDEDIPF